MANKNRILTLLQILSENTDADHLMSTSQVRKALEDKGMIVTVQTLRDDIASLKEAGYQIVIREKTGRPTEYGLLRKDWSRAELRLLADAVSSAQFIPIVRSRELIRKLAKLQGPWASEDLVPRILVSERVKARNRDMIHSVETIRKAIRSNRKITFRYLRYTPNMKQVPRHAGTPDEHYTVSPYATVWNDDRYYLVGWSDRRNAVTVFRLDRMEVPVILPQARKETPAGFDIRDYTDKVFRMYGGPEETVTLRCRMEILDQVIDRFGDGIQLEDVTEEFFTVKVPVCLSTTFYGWVFMFTGQMTIEAPDYVAREYAGYLEKALDDVLAGGQEELPE